MHAKLRLSKPPSERIVVLKSDVNGVFSSQGQRGSRAHSEHGCGKIFCYNFGPSSED